MSFRKNTKFGLLTQEIVTIYVGNITNMFNSNQQNLTKKMNTSNHFQSRYETFGRFFAYICKRYHINHDQLRRAAHIHSNVITDVKGGAVRI